LGFALVFSVSSTFAYRNYYEIEKNDVYFDSFCEGSGGNCLPTHTVFDDRVA
jgi:hypothetical protein